MYRRHQETSPEISFNSVSYTCELCRSNSLMVVFQKLGWKEDPSSTSAPKQWMHTGVCKIGQIPPQEIEVSADLSERLGDTATHYKKALVSRNAGYGIGALAYLRRVVDEQTDALIDVMAELAATYQVPVGDVQALLAAKRNFVTRES